jgi:hypothetical protein
VAPAHLNLRAAIDRLVEERQALRAAAADRATLDENRRALVDCQLEFTRALARDGLARASAA